MRSIFMPCWHPALFASCIPPCRSCRRLRSFDLQKQDQKIAACGSSGGYSSRRRAEQSLHRQKIQEQQALGIVQADPPIALVEHLGQKVQPRDNLAEFQSETQVAALLRD